MIIALWIINILLALAFLLAGGMKAGVPKDVLAKRGMEWVEDFTPAFIKFIGIAEILGALGLVLPLVTRIANVLTPIAAIGLAIAMVCALVVHARRKEPFVPTVVLAVLSIASAVLGFIYIAG
ncbi:MAG: hypothetical protein QOF36_710 [Microbacteriaceae bacterium]|nr:hypothetical protein [Microbacteriaceae bacterium]